MLKNKICQVIARILPLRVKFWVISQLLDETDEKDAHQVSVNELLGVLGMRIHKLDKA